jgi:hypothetical protein
MLAKLKDENGHILIPGFYDDIIPPSPEELGRLEEPALRRGAVPQDRSRLEATGGRGRLQRAGAHLGPAHAGRARHPRRLYRRGRQDGDSRQGVAKVSMRLVPGHDAGQGLRALQGYVEKIAPAGVDVEVRLIHSGDPCLIPVDNRYIQAATKALHEVWGKDTVFIRSGGSIPIVGDFDRHLGLPSVMMGFGLPDDNIHAPNEKFHLKNFELGIESWPYACSWAFSNRIQVPSLWKARRSRALVKKAYRPFASG